MVKQSVHLRLAAWVTVLLPIAGNAQNAPQVPNSDCYGPWRIGFLNTIFHQSAIYPPSPRPANRQSREFSPSSLKILPNEVF
jgi:hypothetical protein